MKLRDSIASVDGRRRTLTLCNVHAGFQRLSLVRSQRRIYGKLAETDLDVHLYGVPDADPPDLPVTAHGHDELNCALLAPEAAVANTYRGFWTDRTPAVDAILDRLEEAYPS